MLEVGPKVKPNLEEIQWSTEKEKRRIKESPIQAWTVERIKEKKDWKLKNEVRPNSNVLDMWPTTDNKSPHVRLVLRTCQVASLFKCYRSVRLCVIYKYEQTETLDGMARAGAQAAACSFLYGFLWPCDYFFSYFICLV